MLERVALSDKKRRNRDRGLRTWGRQHAVTDDRRDWKEREHVAQLSTGSTWRRRMIRRLVNTEQKFLAQISTQRLTFATRNKNGALAYC